MSLGYAELCLRNAFLLAGKARPEQVCRVVLLIVGTAAHALRTRSHTICWCMTCTFEQASILRQYALIKMTYVSLAMNNAYKVMCCWEILTD